MKKLAILSYCLFFFICGSSPAHTATKDEFLSALTRQLNCYPLQMVNMNQQEIAITDDELCLATVYTAIGMQPLWVTEKGPGRKAAVILEFLKNADREGLEPSDYNVQGIEALWQSVKPDDLAQLETNLTMNLIKYAHDVSFGRILPFATDPKLFAEAGERHFKPVLIIEQARAAENFARYLEDLPPAHHYYVSLREALQFYRNIAKAGDWPEVDEGRTLHPGDIDERVNQVRQRLALTENLAPTTGDRNLYDDQLVAVIRKFQEKFGLEQDGIIGRKTLAALNTTPQEIIETICINMARWRWQEHELGRRYIIVNIANYDLKAIEDGQETLKMAVIVGKFQHQTPVFSHRVQYVDFNPFWNIPPSIARNEELPELRKDPMYLVNRKVRLFSSWQADAVELDSTAIDWAKVTPREMNRYKLRQDPGPWNALGPVKLVFPNKYDVYIHGTPSQELFEHNTRSFSHGCIRASQPLKLVEFSLAEEKEDWPLEKIMQIVASGERKIVTVFAPLPVHVTYQTVWVDKIGTIHFNKDIYDRDKKLADILFNRKETTADKT